MRKISNFFVEKGMYVLAFFILLTIVSAWLIPQVTINSDMTKYLPADSGTKAGTAIMENEFPAGSSFNLMIKGLRAEEKSDIQEKLMGYANVKNVAYEIGSEKYNQGSYTLYVVSASVAANTPEVKEIVDSIAIDFKSFDYDISGDAVGDSAAGILPMITSIAFAILIVILFLMCNSWIEPFLFLITIAIAIIINMGSNIIFNSVSSTTNSITAILQLVLSMDYSIMLINRYRQEKQRTDLKQAAMKSALQNAITAIASSSITTIVGMLALVFMSFTIGRDLGLVLAKGVFLSLLCIFTVLPALILLFDKLIEKTAKPSLHIKMDKIGKFSFWARNVMPVVFVVLFTGSFLLRGSVDVAYTLYDYYEVNKIFPPQNQIVVVYDNIDESRVAVLAEKWQLNTDVESVNAYATTLGKELSYDELAATVKMDETLVAQMYHFYFDTKEESDGRKIAIGEFLAFLQKDVAANTQFAAFMTPNMIAQLGVMGSSIPREMIAQELTANELSKFLKIDTAIVKQLYNYYAIVNGEMPQGKITLYDFMEFISNDVAQNEQFKPYFTEDILLGLREARTAMDDGVKELKGEKYSRLILTANLAEESDETFEFIGNLKKELKDTLAGEHYVVGSSAMAYEMNESFPSEMNLITVLTAVAIFLVVAIAFRSLSISLILVLIIQCAVFVTMGTVYFSGSSIYYLPLLIVQCLLMGATVDYGILYTTYYREAREKFDKKEAVITALNNSIHTIMTSASILIIVTGVLGFLLADSDQAISEILMTIARGGLFATLLVVFILPGVMVAFDRFVVNKASGKYTDGNINTL